QKGHLGIIEFVTSLTLLQKEVNWRVGWPLGTIVFWYCC
nr:hypothetical protein [Tanacetum cinerariifolium]